MPLRRNLVFALMLLSACARRGPELVRLPANPPPAVLIHHVSVLDVESGKLGSNRDVLVVGDRIATITASGEAKPPPGTQEISGDGATLLPGLIDMHGHIGNAPDPSWITTFPDPETNLRAFLYCGVTTVLDPADLSSQAFKRRDRVGRGEILGPTIYAAGPMITAPGGHPVALMRELAPWWIRWYLIPRLAIQVDSPEASREAVARIAAMGADVIKLAVDRLPGDAPRIRRDVLEAAVSEARRRGIRAVAHIGTTEDALDAAEAGVSAWMHGVYKERIPDDVIPKLVAFHIPMVATTVVFESYALLGEGPREPTILEKEIARAETLHGFDKIPDHYRPADVFRPFIEELRKHRQDWRDNIRRLRAAGVTILAGSDVQMGVFPGAGLHRELSLLTEAGLTPADAIRAATIDAARFLSNGRDPEFGIVAVGKRADLLVVDGDPTRDLGALARIRAVVKGGVVLERIPISGPSSGG